MEDKKENKTFIMVLIGIIGVCLITIGLTYAYWVLTRQQTGENVVNTACLNINFTGENDITLDKAYPMKPDKLESFLSTATPYHFTIENTCDDLATATINLESLNAGTDKQLQDEYIDAILYETDYHTNLNSIKKLSASMYNDENKVISSSLHAYQLYSFVLQKGETKSFNLLLYMDADTPMETSNMNASWKGKITLSTEYKEEKLANLNGLKVPVVESGDGLYEVSHDVSEISTDWNKTEYRYAGSNVNNYVSFNNEIWRVIGLVNVQTDNGIEQRLKIIRQDGIEGQLNFGNYGFDKKQQGDGSSHSEYGSNDWTDSQLKDMLNGIYYNNETGDCWIGDSEKSSNRSTCSFSGDGTLPKGLDSLSKNMIDNDIVWTLGGTGDFISESNGLVNHFYQNERGTAVYINEPRQAIWSKENDENYNGIGLLYISDYGYATSGGSLGKDACYKNKISSWYSGDYYNECAKKDWLRPKKGDTWCLTLSSNTSDEAFLVYTGGDILRYKTEKANSVWPTLYLKSSVKITSNPHSEQEYGTIDNPFQLSVQ